MNKGAISGDGVSGDGVSEVIPPLDTLVSSATAASSMPGKKRIVVMDNDEDVRYFLKCVLEGDYEVELYQNAAEALGGLNQAAKDDKNYDLMIFDMNNPSLIKGRSDLGGLQLIAFLKGYVNDILSQDDKDALAAKYPNVGEKYKDVPIMLATGSEDNKLIGAGKSMGAVHIEKPFNLSDFIDKVNEMVLQSNYKP